MENVLVIILAIGIGMFHDDTKPIQYELMMADGSQTQIILQKNSQYACPLYCETDHIHHAVMCNDEIQINNHQSVYHIIRSIETEHWVYCSFQNILSMHKFGSRIPKDNLPDLVNVATEE